MSSILKLLSTMGLIISTFSVQAAAIEQEEKMDAAIEVLDRISNIPEDTIPPALLRNASGIAVIPGVIKAGFIIGGSYGKGLMSVKNAQGRWSPPLFIKLAAGSLGWQIGAQSTDVILVFKTPRSVEGIVRGTFKLGADAAVAAGPVGRRGEAATDTDLKAEILSYSRSRGLFAGVSLEGSKLDVDHGANQAYYGKPVRGQEIIDGKVTAPASAIRLLQTIGKATIP